MNKKTKTVVAIAAAYIVAECLARGWKINLLRKEIVRLEHTNQVLTEGNAYFQRVALAAFKRIPVSQIGEMQTDLDFLKIVTKEDL